MIFLNYSEISVRIALQENDMLSVQNVGKISADIIKCEHRKIALYSILCHQIKQDEFCVS